MHHHLLHSRLFCTHNSNETTGSVLLHGATLIVTLLCVQVYYHLGAYEESLTYALGAGDLFNVNDNSEFVQTIIGEFCSVKRLLTLYSYSLLLWLCSIHVSLSG